MRKPLPLSDITRRLSALGFKKTTGPPGLVVYNRTLAPYFPYATQRTVAYHVPGVYEQLPLLPLEIVDDILLHLFLDSEEEEKFWNNEETVN